MSWTDPRIERRKQREAQAEAAGRFGETYYGQNGETLSYAALAPVAAEAQPQLELKLEGASKNHVTRQLLSQRIAAMSQRRYEKLGEIDCYLDRLAAKLRDARQKGTFGIRVNNGKMVWMWDTKAGLSRLCPDDAREESMRLQRKVMEPLLDLQAAGHALHYVVLTAPNFGPGKLKEGMAYIHRRFRQLRKAKFPDGSLRFPEIRGALTVLEAPLGGYRDWHVHLNCILVVKGFLDYEKLRAWWHWNLHAEKLPAHHDREQSRELLRGALAELIKYVVAATVAKSREKNFRARDGEDRPRPPSMLEWSDAELYEFIYAMKGFRRTRSYGELYKIKKPEREELGEIIHIGQLRAIGGAIVARCALLESIPGDNFPGMSGADRWRALKKALSIADLEGDASIGADIPARIEYPT